MLVNRINSRIKKIIMTVIASSDSEQGHSYKLSVSDGTSSAELVRGRGGTGTDQGQGYERAIECFSGKNIHDSMNPPPPPFFSTHTHTLSLLSHTHILSRPFLSLYLSLSLLLINFGSL